MVLSPVTGSANTHLLKRINSSEVVQLYAKEGVDVSPYFNGIDHIELHECLDSGLSFYYPHTIVGDSKFYQDLQKFDWYYVDSKWEFHKGIELIKNGEKVLEIGSGRGQFLSMLSKKTKNAEGLELNPKGLEEIKSKGLKAHLLKIDEFEAALPENEKFDVVCSFQVFEHIENIGQVIQSSVNVLKKGGHLIISVPNDDCPFNSISFNPFNLPPHHQGLWNAATFEKLETILNLRLKGIFVEPTSFFNKFRAAAALTRAEKLNKTSSVSYISSLLRIFRNKKLAGGRTIMGYFEKL
jgi:2-polyprenyl-3-methyl-5-hydroxy-6-metoxy-1,4-benzoquinol methylase